ncbi:MAG: MATE family efflux transporter [Lachnospiraceae bacterium]|nr:MATE family efflux transporter [Lachnospiraceae bacterium]
MKKQIDLLSDSTNSLFLRYLLPSISATLVTSIYILADTVMIGKGIGSNGIAAINIVIPIFTIFFGLGLLFGVGGAVLMSMAFGENKIEKGQKYFTTSVITVTTMVLICWIVFGFNLTKVLYIFGATANTIHLAQEYGIVLVYGVPIFMFSSMLQVYVRNDKAPNTAMLGVICGGVSNVILDYVFIFMLKMGMAGGAIATVIGSSITVLILCTHFFSKANNLKIVKNGFSFVNLRKITTNGFASFLVEISSGVVVCLFNIQLVKYVGDVGVAVYGIISNSSIVAMSLANGVAQAAQPIIATNFGAGKLNRVNKVCKTGVAVALGIGILLCIIGEAIPNTITAAFVEPTPEITSLSVMAIKIYFISFIAMTVNIFFGNYFQSTMDPNYSLIICITRGLLLSSILVLLLPKVMGVVGIWLVMPIVEFLTALLVLFMKFRKRTGA